MNVHKTYQRNTWPVLEYSIAHLVLYWLDYYFMQDCSIGIFQDISLVFSAAFLMGTYVHELI